MSKAKRRYEQPGYTGGFGGNLSNKHTELAQDTTSLDEWDSTIFQNVDIEDPNKIEPAVFEFTSTGVLISGKVTPGDMLRKIKEVAYIEFATHWAYGDLLAYSEDQKWGEMYDSAIELTGKSYQTLANYVWVARCIPFSLRGENLSYSHYKIIAGLDAKDRKEAIDAVVQYQFSRREFLAYLTGEELPNQIPEWRKPVHSAYRRYKARWDTMTPDDRRAAYGETELLLREMESWGFEENKD